MTSNERKIINFLREVKEKAHVRLVAQKTNFSNDYARFLCHSLARAGYITLEDSNTCCLLEKGRGHSESVATMREASEPVVAFANVTLLTNDPSFIKTEEGKSAATLLVNDRDDNADQSAKDEELDKALADLNPIPEKNESETIDKTEGPENMVEPQIMAESAEIEEEKKAEIQESGKTEVRPADNPASAAVAPLEGHEKIVPKEEPAKPSGGFGVSFKKIVNWFAEKK